MGTFLLIILLLIFLLLYPVIKAAFKVWLQVRQMNREFRNAAGQQQYGANRREGTGRARNSRNDAGNTRRRGKIFSPGDGEYVEFEEIIEQRQATRYVDVRDTEPRISDAKFEDL